MQGEAVDPGEGEPRLWRRIIDFPLVALLISLTLFFLALGVGDLLGRLVPPMGAEGSAVAKAVISIAVVLAVYKLAIARLGEQRRDDLPVSGALRNTALGLLSGFVIFALIVAAAAAVGVYRITGEGDGSQLVLELVGTAIMPGFMEELLFRGIIQRWLQALGGSWFGLVLASLAFGFAHYFNPNSTVIACVWIAIEAGILLGAAYMLTGSLWFPMGLHAAWNFTQGEIFDIPVSGLDEHGLVQAKLSGPLLLTGGQFGLEASVLALIIGTAAGLSVLWLAAKRGSLVTPLWRRS